MSQQPHIYSMNLNCSSSIFFSNSKSSAKYSLLELFVFLCSNPVPRFVVNLVFSCCTNLKNKGVRRLLFEIDRVATPKFIILSDQLE